MHNAQQNNFQMKKVQAWRQR